MRRILTALALIPIVVYVVLWANYWVFLGVVALSACLCYREYNDIAAAYGFGEPGLLGYAAGLVLLAWPGWPVLVAAALVAFLLSMRMEDLSKALPHSALLVTGIVYAFGCWVPAGPLRAASPHWLMFALILNWVGDTGAYVVGRKFGKHKLAPRVSPKKSWEGAAASVVTSVLFAGSYLVWFVRVPVHPRRAAHRCRQHRRATRRPGRIRHQARRRRQRFQQHSARPRRVPGPRGQHPVRSSGSLCLRPLDVIILS